MEPLASWLSAVQRELGLEEVMDVRLLVDCRGRWRTRSSVPPSR